VNRAVDALWGQLALVAALVLLNAAFAGSEIALISLRESQLTRLAGRGRGGRALADLTEDPNRFLATIQIGITLAGFLASATAAVTLAEPVAEVLEPLGRAARPAAIMVVTTLLAFVTLVLGELTPKRIAMQRAEAWGLLAARPLSLLATAASPGVWLLGRTTDLVVRLLGGDPEQQREDVTEEELRDMVAVQPQLTDEERAIIDGAFELADRTLRQILVPRPQVVALAGALPATEGVATLVATGHSRAPVYRGDLDDVLGIVHLRSLLDGRDSSIAEHTRPALVMPETVNALDALRALQAERQQMAIVINEHGGTEGIITVEDLVEELVGEIWDEADPDVQAVEHHTDGSLILAGAYPVHDLDEIDVDLPDGSYATVAGLILEHLGRLPIRGEAIRVGHWRLEVLEISHRRITRVRLAPIGPTPDGGSGAGAAR
jgi:putative hemolysin